MSAAMFDFFANFNRDCFKGTPVKFFDVLKMTLPANNVQVDLAHYSLFVMKEMVNALLSDLLSSSPSL